MPGKPGPTASIGGRIATARFRLAAERGKNVTQAWLAAQCGVSGPTVSQWETGVIEPTIGSIAKIAQALGVSAGWLAFGEGVEATRTDVVDTIINPAADRKLTPEEIARARKQVDADRASKSGAARKKGNGRRA